MLPGAADERTQQAEATGLRRAYQARKQEEATLAKKTVNAEREATFRAKGQKFYADSFGNLQPEVDDQGKPRFAQSDWKKTQIDTAGGGKAWALARRNESGQTETRAPKLVTSGDLKDPNLYHDFGGLRGEREVAGHVDDLAQSTDPETASTAAKYRDQRNKAIRAASVKPLNDALASAEVEIGSTQLKKDALETRRSKLAEQISALDSNPAIKQTAGGFLGLGAEPTEEAKRLQSQRAALQTEADSLSQETGQLDAAVKTGGALYRKHEQAKIERDLWVNETKLSGLDDQAETRRAWLKKQGRTEDGDPVLAQILAKQEEFGVKASRIASRRATDDQLSETGQAEGEALNLSPAQLDRRAREFTARRNLNEQHVAGINTALKDGERSPEIQAEMQKAETERRALLVEQNRLTAAQRKLVEKQKAERTAALTGLSDTELMAGVDSLAADLKERQTVVDRYSSDPRIKKETAARVAALRDQTQSSYALLDAERKRRGLTETPAEKKKSEGVLMSGARGVLAGAGNINRMAAGVLATGGDLTGWDWLRDSANEFSEAQKGVIEERGPAISTLNDVDSVASAFKYVSGQVGTQAPIFGAAAAAGIMAKGVAMIPSVGKAISTISGAKKAGNATLAAQQAAQFTQTAANLGTGVALQTGSIQSDLLDLARDKFAEDLKAGKAEGDIHAYRERYVQPLPILTLGLATGLLEGLSFNNVLKTAGVQKQATRGFFDILHTDGIGRRVLKSVMAAEASEIPTELLQTLGERLATKWVDPESKYFTPELADALRETAAATLVSTGPIGALGGIRKPVNDSAIEDAVRAIEQVAAVGRNLRDLDQWQQEELRRPAMELIPADRIAEVATAAADNPQDAANAAAVADVRQRADASTTAVSQIAAAPDFVAVDLETGEPINDPTTLGANRDAARALVKVSNGYAVADLTEAEAQGLATIGEQLGSDMVRDVSGEPVITDKAREWAVDLVPAAGKLIRETETERLASIAAATTAAATPSKGASKPNEKDQIQKEKGLLKPTPSAAPAVESSRSPAAGASASVSFTNDAGKTERVVIPAGATVPSSGAPVRDQASAEQYLAETRRGTVRDVEFMATQPGKPTASPTKAAPTVAKSAAVAPRTLMPHLVKRMRAAGANDRAIVTAATGLAKRVNETVARYSGLFGGRVEITNTPARSGGFAYDANRDTLVISAADLGTDAETLAANPERMDKLIREEAIHRAAVRLEKSGAWKADDLWKTLTPATRDAFTRAYNQGRGEADGARTTGAWSMGHEMVRMLVQGRLAVENGRLTLDGAAISEETASPSLLAKIADILAKIRDYFTDLAGQLAKDGNDPAAIAEVNRVVELITRKLQALEKATTAPSADTVERNTAETVEGEKLKGEWVAFAPESGTLGIPRTEMPQFQNEHLGALTQFLAARGITHTIAEVLPGTLKPSQAEYSTKKVANVVAKAASGQFGPRSILVSSDGYILDRHHQFVAALTGAPETPIPIIRFSAPIRELFDVVQDFPSVEYAKGAKSAPAAGKAEPATKPTAPAPAATTERAALAATLGLPEAQVGSIETVTHKGRTVRVVNLVVDASQIETSHSPDGSANPNYPQSLQPRDRSAAVYRDQQRRIASNPNLAEEFLSGTPDRGTPIVAALPGRSPFVLIGNGRANAKALMYAVPDLAETAAKFKQDIAARAAEKGLTPEAVNGVTYPVLVRQILDPLTLDELRAFSQESNEFSGAATNAVEQAKVDASRLTPGTLAFFNPEFDLDSAKNDDFRREFVRSVIGRAENITGPDLRRRVQAALFAKAFGDTEAGMAAFSRLAGEDDEGTRNLVRAMLDVAPAFAALRTQIAAGNLHDLDLAPALTRAVQEIAVALREKPTAQPADLALDSLVNQNDLALEGARDPLDDTLLRFLVANRRNRADLIAGLNAYVAGVYAAGDPKQADMFGAEPPTAATLLRTAVEDPQAGERALAAAGIGRVLNSQTAEEEGAQLIAMFMDGVKRDRQAALAWEDYNQRLDAEVKARGEIVETFQRNYSLILNRFNSASRIVQRRHGLPDEFFGARPVVKGKRRIVEKLVFGDRLASPGDFIRGMREMKDMLGTTLVIRTRAQAEAVRLDLLRVMGLDPADRALVSPKLQLANPDPRNEGYRDDKLRAQFMPNRWGEVIITTPAIYAVKTYGVGHAAYEIRRTIDALFAQGIAVPAALADLNERAARLARFDYEAAWAIDSALFSSPASEESTRAQNSASERTANPSPVGDRPGLPSGPTQRNRLPGSGTKMQNTSLSPVSSVPAQNLEPGGALNRSGFIAPTPTNEQANRQPTKITAANISDYSGNVDVSAIRGRNGDLWRMFDRAQLDPQTGRLVSLDRLISTKDELRDPKFIAGQKKDPRQYAIDAMGYSLAGDPRNEKGPRAPLDVFANADGTFTIIDGNATAQAAMLAGWKTIPINVRPAPVLASAPASDDLFGGLLGDYAQALPPAAKRNKAAAKKLVAKELPALPPAAFDDLFAFAQAQPETPSPSTPAPARAFTAQESDNFFPPSDKKSTASDKAANAIVANLRDGRAFDWRQLFAITDEAFGGTQADGTYTVKDAYDALELGLNRFIRADFLQDGALTGPGTLIKTRGAVMQLKQLLTLVPTQTKRTAEMDEFQQFSTVPPLAFVANWVANLQTGEVYLEPSAGVGGLGVFGQIAGAKVYANELSTRRANLLKTLGGFAGVFTENAEQLNNTLPNEVQADVVVMNPPFSATAGRISGSRDTNNATVHIEQALKRLNPGGRLVAIVGEGMADDRPAFRAWWAKMKQAYAVRANIGVSGAEYAKYGTTFDNQILVIDKTDPQSYGETTTGRVEKVEDLLPLLQTIRHERPQSSPSLLATPGRNRPTQSTRGGARSAVGGAGTAVSETGAISVADEGRTGGAGLGTRAQSDQRPAESSGVGSSVALGDRRSEVGGTELSGVGAPAGGNAAVLQRGDRAEPGVTYSSAETKATSELTDKTFDSYAPKILVPGATMPPVKLDESAAMASVDPIKPTYRLAIPREFIVPEQGEKEGRLSAIALESIILAGNAHQEMVPAAYTDDERKDHEKRFGKEPPKEFRRGFFIGDGTGAGKGRQAFGIILDNWKQGRRKALWVSEKPGLVKDARRDARDVAQMDDKIFEIGKAKAADSISRSEGVGFVSYATLRAKAESKDPTIAPKTRIDQIVDWLGADFDGAIIFDESHNMAKNTAVKGKRGMQDASQQALAGVELQRRLPNARVTYLSATGATEVSNLGYADRLGLWGPGTPFANKKEFTSKISAGGVAAMELVARDMKAMGLYLARSLSWDGVTYDRVEHKLADHQREIYDALAEGWQSVLNNMTEALKVTGAVQTDAESGKDRTLNKDAKSAMLSRFWGTHQRFFNQVITAMKMPTVLSTIKDELAKGNAIVVQLVNTNQASLERALTKQAEEDGDLEDLDMTPRDQLIQMVESSFPVIQQEQYEDEDGNIRSRPAKDSAGNPVLNREAVAMREALVEKLASIRVPDGPLEMLINEIGKERVAEITGRTRRVVWGKDAAGRVAKVIETRGATQRDVESQDFMDDKRQVLVFSNAGGTGRSYHADLKAKNQRKRIHLLLQPGWQASQAVQGFGRTHRNNQKQPPHYALAATDIVGEKRFMSSIARRLDQLGALTKGERKTGSQGLFNARDNLESQEAHDALEILFRDVMAGHVEGVTEDDFTKQMGLKLRDQEGNSLNELPPITQFLNRLLSLKLDMQERVFRAFEERHQIAIERALANGTLDTGMETLKALSTKLVSEKVINTDARSGAKTSYAQLDLTLPTERAQWHESLAEQTIYKNLRTGKVFAGGPRSTRTTDDGRIIDTRQMRGIAHNSEIRAAALADPQHWQELRGVDAKAAWEQEYATTPATRTERAHVLTGTLLNVWDRLPSSRPRVLRIQTDDGRRMIGRKVDEADIGDVLQNFGVAADSATFTPTQVVQGIMQNGATARLANGWTIKRKLVSGENRLELTGPSFPNHAELDTLGIGRERIQFNTRYFIPTGTQAESIVEKLTATRPVTSLDGGEKTGTLASGRANVETDTPEFKAWFSDSKVVDDAGRPRVVFHGTGAKFDSFKPSANAYYGPGGMYFSSKREAAQIFADQAISGGRIVSVYLSIQNPFYDDGSTEPSIAKLKRQGYDGIIAESDFDGGDTMFVAFTPTQIKSATANRGTFDPTNPSILASGRATLADPNQLEFEEITAEEMAAVDRALADVDRATRVKDALPVADKIAAQFRIPGLDPADVRQEARTSLITAARAYEPARGAFAPYAGTIIRNHLRDLFNREVRRVRQQGISTDATNDAGASILDQAPADDNTRTGAEFDETRRLLADALAALPPRLQNILNARSQGESFAAIGAREGISKQAATKLAENAMRFVRAKLKKAGVKSLEADGVLASAQASDQNDRMASGDGAAPQSSGSPQSGLVTDKNGSPRLLYRGQAGQIPGELPAGGIHFSSDPEYSRSYAVEREATWQEKKRGLTWLKPHIEEAYLRIEKPLDLRGAKTRQQVEAAFSRSGIPLTTSVELYPHAKLQGNTDYSGSRPLSQWFDLFERTNRFGDDFSPNEDLTDGLGAAVKPFVDGIIFDEHGDPKVTSYVIFNRSQIVNPNLSRGGSAAQLHSSPAEDEQAIAELMRDLARDVPSGVIDAAARQGANEPPGNQTVGNPDLANPAGPDAASRGVMNAVDEARKETMERETHEQWRTAAVAMLERDRPGVLRDLLAKASDGLALDNPVQVKAAQLLVNDLIQKAVTTKDPQAMRDAQILAWSYREGGTEQARAFAARRDPFKKPADRYREFLAGAVFTPTPALRKQLASTWSPAEKQRRIASLAKQLADARAQIPAGTPANAIPADAQKRIAALNQALGTAQQQKDRIELLNASLAERMQRIEAEFAKMGVTLDDMFAGDAYLRLRGQKIDNNIFDAANYSAIKRRALSLIKKGWSDDYIARKTGLTTEQVGGFYQEHVAALRERLAKLGDAALDPDKLDALNLASASARLASAEAGLSAAERAARIEQMIAAMGYARNDVREKRTRRAPPARRNPKTPPSAPTSTATEPGALPTYPDAAGTPADDFGNRNLGLGEDPAAQPPGATLPTDATGRPNPYDFATDETAPPVFDIADPVHVAQAHRIIQAIDANGFDMVSEFHINSVLSGPLTQGANIIGNSANTLWDFTFKRAGEAALNGLVKDANAPQIGEFKHMLRAIQPALARAWRNALRTWTAESPMFENDVLNQQLDLSADFEKGGSTRAAIPGRTGKVIRTPGRLLMATDDFFKTWIAHVEAAAQGYRIAKSEGLTGPALEARIAGLVNLPGSPAWLAAVAKAQELTFQEKHEGTGAGRLLQALGNLRELDFGGGVKPLRFVLMFVRTPFNIFAQGLRQSPAGMALLLGRFIRAGFYRVKDGRPIAQSYPQPQAIKHTVEQLMAWTATAIIYGAAAGDDDDEDKPILITGSIPYKDPGTNALNQRTARTPYTVRVGNVMVSYGRIEPAATILGTAVDMIQAVKRSRRDADQFDALGALMQSVGQQAEEKTFLRGIGDLFGAVQGARKGERANYAAQFLSSFVPNLIRQPLAKLDPNARDRTGGFGERLASSIVPQLAEPKIDAYGEKIAQPGLAGWRALVPIAVRQTPEVNRVDRLLTNWNQAHPDDDWAPVPLNRTLRLNAKTTRQMTAPELRDYAMRSGRMAAQMLRNAALNIEKPTAEDMKRVKNAFTTARTITRRQMFGATSQEIDTP